MSIDEYDPRRTQPQLYFSGKPLASGWSKVEVKETSRLWADNSEQKTDFAKPFIITCEGTIKDARKLRKLFCPKKHRLPRKLKKAMRGVAGVTPYGEWVIHTKAFCHFEVKTKWQRKADDIIRSKMCEYYERNKQHGI